MYILLLQHASTLTGHIETYRRIHKLLLLLGSSFLYMRPLKHVAEYGRFNQHDACIHLEFTALPKPFYQRW